MSFFLGSWGMNRSADQTKLIENCFVDTPAHLQRQISGQDFIEDSVSCLEAVPRASCDRELVSPR